MGTRCFYAHSTFAPERDQKTSAAITARRNKNKSVGGSCKAGICCCMLEFCACHVNKSTVCITPIWKRKHVHTMWNMHRCKMWTVEKLLLVCTSFPESWWIIRFHADDSSSLLRHSFSWQFPWAQPSIRIDDFPVEASLPRKPPSAFWTRLESICSEKNLQSEFAVRRHRWNCVMQHEHSMFVHARPLLSR